MARLAALVLLSLGLFILVSGTGLAFDMGDKGVAKCFMEALGKQQVAQGVITTTAHPSLRLKFWVEGGEKQQVYVDDLASPYQFSFSAALAGEYRFCFVEVERPGMPQMALGIPPRRVLMEVKFDAPDAPKKSSKAVLKPVEEKLLKLQEIALSIEKEAIYTKDREADHRDVSEELNSRVSWLSVLTIIILLVLGVTQVYYLQTYLKKTKWIE